VSSQFSPGEFGSIIIAWIVLSFGITYASFVGLFNGSGGSLDFVVAGFVATATGFIIHEMGHKFVAIRRGYVAHFRLWTWGLVLTLFTAVATGGSFLFGAPGAVYIAPAAAVGYGYGYSWSYRATDEEYENMIISAAGPGINLLVCSPRFHPASWASWPSSGLSSTSDLVRSTCCLCPRWMARRFSGRVFQLHLR